MQGITLYTGRVGVHNSIVMHVFVLKVDKIGISVHAHTLY